MTMIERVARAMAGYVGHRDWGLMAVDRSDLRSRIKDGYDVNEPTQGDMMEAARAAIEALRDLPEDVIAAGERAAWDNHNHMPAIRAMPRAVAAMIDTIIRESA